MKILVAGSNGQLGRELRTLAENTSHHFIFTTRKELDLTDQQQLENAFYYHQPDVFVNAAAYTNVDQAEDQSEEALMVNGKCMENVAKTANFHRVHVMHVSTDYVFDGKRKTPYVENDPVNPINEYGVSKAAGEFLLKEYGESFDIFRTSWLYSPYRNNFFRTMLKLSAEREELRVVSDQFGTPTYARNLALVMLQSLSYLPSSGRKEIFHYSDEGEISWFDFAKEISERAGNRCQIHPISTEEYPTKAKRPSYTVMSKEKVKERFEFHVPDWKIGVEQCVNIVLNKGNT